MSWDLVMKENGGSNSEVEFVKIANGTTKLRILGDEPKAMWKHWLQQANGGKGMSVMCIGRDKCPVCKANAEAEKSGLKKKYSVSQSFAMNALIKVDGVYKVQILEKGKTLFKSLHTIMSKMGALENYEVNIDRTGEKMQDTTYTVLPEYPPKSLSEMHTADEIAKFRETMIDLEEYYTPLSSEDITALMEGGTLQPKEDTTPDFTVED